MPLLNTIDAAQRVVGDAVAGAALVWAERLGAAEAAPAVVARADGAFDDTLVTARRAVGGPGRLGAWRRLGTHGRAGGRSYAGVGLRGYHLSI